MKKINALALSTITAFALIGCGGGGSSGGSSSSTAGTITPTTPVITTDITAPVITSASTFTVNENQNSAFTITATDDSTTPLTYSLSGTDATLFDINPTTGIVTFKTVPDFETKNSYSVTVNATDTANNSSSKDVTINISDMDEIAPTITSNSIFTVNENQTSAFTATATDISSISSYALSGTDVNSFNIDSTTGIVTFKSNTDYETKSSYSIILTATDSQNNSSTQNVTINIVNLDETTPTFTSSSTVSVNENQTSVITATAIDDSTITYSISGTDVSYFDIVSNTGVITFKTNPDYETKSSYSITVKATDSSNNEANQNLTVNLNDVDEVAPVITSLTSYSVAENQITAFTVIATDSSNITYSISGGTDASLFSINPTTGVVTFNSSPDYESGKTSYSVTVKATDSSNNFSTKAVTVNITDVVETTGVFKTGQTTSYATGDDGYYASTLGVARSFTRTNEIVTDNITKLQWQDDATASTTTADWNTATTSTCQNLTLGGYSDWKLPTIEELESIVNYGAVAPAKYSEFLNMASNIYWSSTTDASNSGNAWLVSFSYGDDAWNYKSYSYYVRCVRAGQ